jgi:hypothetical protein
MEQNCSEEQYYEICYADAGICERQGIISKCLLPYYCLEKKAPKREYIEGIGYYPYEGGDWQG